jgi:membrane protein YdbS with pleckstrin-like domain
MTGFLQENDKDGKPVFSLRRLLAMLAFALGWGSAIAIGVLGYTQPETKWIVMALLGFSTVTVLLLLGYTTMQDLKEIAKEIKGKNE